MIKLKDCPFEIMQKEKEINQVVEEIYNAKGDRTNLEILDILEIGSFYGGTLWYWKEAFPIIRKIMSIDYPVPPSDGRYQKMIDSKAKWSELFKDIDFVAIDADSHNDETFNKVRMEFPNGIDFCFIDGDHSYIGCLADYTMYRQLMKPDGIMAFHDISRECKDAWEEIKKNHKTIECKDDNNTMGIGLVIL